MPRVPYLDIEDLASEHQDLLARSEVEDDYKRYLEEFPLPNDPKGRPA